MNLIEYSGEFSSESKIKPYDFLLFNLITKIKEIKDNSKNCDLSNELKIDYLKVVENLTEEKNKLKGKDGFIEDLERNLDVVRKENKEKIRNVMLTTTSSLLSSIRSINDIYDLFSFSEISSIFTESDVQNPFYFNCETFIKGGKIDNFLRRIWNSFRKSSFGDLVDLFYETVEFREGRVPEEIGDRKRSLGELEEVFEGKEGGLINHSSLSDSLNNFHKIYDYNLKYLYDINPTNDKIQYTLLYTSNLYYEFSYYEKAINVLFECVKICQSNCDHQALIKCFLWLGIIYMKTGEYKLGVQYLKTCLIKSFQNNYQILYLISSVELSNLCLIFGIRTEEINNKTKASLEERIVSHSNNYELLYKNIADFFTLKDNTQNQNISKEKTENLETLLLYTNIQKIIDYYLEGKIKLSLTYLSVVVSEVLKEEFNFNDSRELMDEFIFSLITIISLFIDHDLDFALNSIINLLLKYSKTSKKIASKIQTLLVLVSNKILNKNRSYKFKIIDGGELKKLGLYFYFNYKYDELVKKFDEIVAFDLGWLEFEEELLEFIEELTSLSFHSLQKRATLLKSSLYSYLNRPLEALQTIKDIQSKHYLNPFESLKIQLLEAEFSTKLNSFDKCRRILAVQRENFENCLDLRGKSRCLRLDFEAATKENKGKNKENLAVRLILAAKFAALRGDPGETEGILMRIKESFEGKFAGLEEKIMGILRLNEKIIGILNGFDLEGSKMIGVIKLMHENNKRIVGELEKYL